MQEKSVAAPKEIALSGLSDTETPVRQTGRVADTGRWLFLSGTSDPGPEADVPRDRRAGWATGRPCPDRLGGRLSGNALHAASTCRPT